jgi:hypothetical protein
MLICSQRNMKQDIHGVMEQWSDERRACWDGALK